MKVFLSWSGERSRLVAEALRDWLPDIINAVEPWMSTEIDKGAASMNEIGSALQGCSFAIICVTPGNKLTPWINYEAGALSKAVGDDPARVATLLVGMKSPTEVTGPLAQFQATKLELEDFKRLMRAMDAQTGKPRETSRLDRVVERAWPELKERLDAAVATVRPAAPKATTRSSDDKIDEILSTLREVKRAVEYSPTSRVAHTLRAKEELLKHVMETASFFGAPDKLIAQITVSSQKDGSQIVFFPDGFTDDRAEEVMENIEGITGRRVDHAIVPF